MSRCDTEDKKNLSHLVSAYLKSHQERLLVLENIHALVLQQAEKPLIQIVLEGTQYNQSKAAKILGLNRNTLKKKMILLGLVKTENA